MVLGKNFLCQYCTGEESGRLPELKSATGVFTQIGTGRTASYLSTFWFESNRVIAKHVKSSRRAAAAQRL
jgi:hypothetical protein